MYPEHNARKNALELKNREEITNAWREQKLGKIISKASNMRLLVNTLNECAGVELASLSSYKSCGGCRKFVLNFWRGIIEEWKKES